MFFLMIPRPPVSTPINQLIPVPTLFRSEHTQAITFAQTPDVRDTEEGAHARAAQAPTVSAGEPVGLEDEGAGADRLMLLSRRDWHLKLRRSEEHTSELQSLMRISYAVFCLKNNTINKLERYKNY